MSAHGEYMIVPTRQIGIMQEPENKGPWICPMIRCRRELGIKLDWGDEGCYLYGGNLPRPIEAEIINDLPYIDKEQFEDIRLALAASHRRGRIPAKGYQENRRTWQPVDPRGHKQQLYAFRSPHCGTRWKASEKEPHSAYHSNWNNGATTWSPYWNQYNTMKWNYHSDDESHSE